MEEDAVFWYNYNMEKEIKKGEIIIYKTPDKKIQVDVSLDKETIWLNQEQIALLFGTQRPAITKHLKNIFKNKELDEKLVSSILEHTTKHGAIKGKIQRQSAKFYNLDAIISVGYRVNSKRATDFRVWATKTLKQYLVEGYVVNEKRLLQAENKFKELQSAVNFLQKKSFFNSLFLWHSIFCRCFYFKLCYCYKK